MSHKCAIQKEDAALTKLGRCQTLRMISADNPLSLGNFRSENGIRDEQLRHLVVNIHAIHPFSKLNAWYNMFLIYLYISVLLTKPIDAAFMKYGVARGRYIYRLYTILTDIFCWIDIILKFFIGFEVKRNRVVELRNWHIAKHYLLGPFFVCDVLSSVPKSLFYFLVSDKSWNSVLGVVCLVGLLKIVRIVSVVHYIRQTVEYFEVKSRSKVFLLYTFITSLMIIHWVACMQFAVPRFFRQYFKDGIDKHSWYYEDKGRGPLYMKAVLIQYTHCFFKGSAYILGIRLRTYELNTEEEYVLVIVSYFLGKIIMGFIWIILSVTILNSRLMDIKFAEIINQLEEYMRQKQLPLNLRARILQYFIFKYRGRYFQEELITSLLSDNLRKEASLHSCRSLIKNVSLFSELSSTEMSKMVDFLIPEIFLPNDTIIHAGTQGDAMYFLSSGTVAVYTRSGKEVCHLQDGAYFGEISLVLKGQLRLTTIVALETSQVYRLNKKDLEKYLLSNKSVMSKILGLAEMRLKQTTKLEEEYKEMLFEQSYRKISASS